MTFLENCKRIFPYLGSVISTVLQGFVANLLKSAFPHLSDNQIKITVTGLFNLNQDIPGFKVAICFKVQQTIFDVIPRTTCGTS